jgi:hypothetical protein
LPERRGQPILPEGDLDASGRVAQDPPAFQGVSPVGSGVRDCWLAYNLGRVRRLLLTLAAAVAFSWACFPSFEGLAGMPEETTPPPRDGSIEPPARDAGTDASLVPEPTCTDGEKNGTETDVDCGGECPPCTRGRACRGPADCVTADASTCFQSTCCTPYTRSTGQGGGNLNICCHGTDARSAVKDCAVGDNHYARESTANCAEGSEGANNNGTVCIEITCMECTRPDSG